MRAHGEGFHTPCGGFIPPGEHYVGIKYSFEQMIREGKPRRAKLDAEDIRLLATDPEYPDMLMNHTIEWFEFLNRRAREFNVPYYLALVAGPDSLQ